VVPGWQWQGPAVAKAAGGGCGIHTQPCRHRRARGLREALAADAACGLPAAGRGGDGKYDLCADDREWVERIAVSLGPLTDKQRDILGLLLRKRRC